MILQKRFLSAFVSVMFVCFDLMSEGLDSASFEDDPLGNVSLNDAQSYNISIVSIYKFLLAHDSVQYLQSNPASPFCFKPFPLSLLPQEQPYQGQFSETFILNIPNGRVCSADGWIIVDDCMFKELIWKSNKLGLKGLYQTDFENVQKISGRVAVITQRGASCYFHWITEVLGRFAMLELQGIEYDWLYVPTSKPFMKESLILWGVDPSKIIEPSGDTHYIQADELIVPSLVSKISAGYTRFASYVPDQIVWYVKEKLLAAAEQKLGFDLQQSKKRVFISRKDAKIRQMINEDEVFSLFEQQGFERYDLSYLSILEQIVLFYNAEMVVGSHGAGLTNTIFCQPGTQIIELFQARGSATYWYISQMLGLRHLCVQTTDFDLAKNGFLDTYVPLSIIENVLLSIL